MKGIDLYINKSKNELLVNKYGSYKFFYHKQTGGPGFHSKFNFSVSPFQTAQNYETISIEFSDSLDRFETVIRERFIYEAFKNGIEKFAQNLKETGVSLSNSIKIEILDYEPHPIDSKPVCNEVCIEQVLNHIYCGSQLPDKAILEIEYEEYQTI